MHVHQIHRFWWIERPAVKDSSEDQKALAAVNDILCRPGRLLALQMSQALAHDTSPEFARTVAFAARLLGVPAVVLSFADARQEYVLASSIYAELGELPKIVAAEDGLSRHVIEAERTVSVSDLDQAEEFNGNPLIEALGAKGLLGVPIRSQDAFILGALSAMDTTQRDWTDENAATLRDLAKVIEAELVMRATVANRDLVLREMTHRVKNLCTVVIGMIRLDYNRSETASDLANRLRERVQALGSAYSLIAPVVTAGAIPAQTTNLRDVATRILRPCMVDGHLTLEGPDVIIGEKATVALALALHEIMTNAVKYGALSSVDGRVKVEWKQSDSGLTLRWQESSFVWVPDQIQSEGFGTQLLDLSIRQNLGGRLATHVEPNSFEIEIELPPSGYAH